MTYIRCDKDCEVAAGQLSEAGVPIKELASAIVTQKVSGITYEIYNKDYVRSNLFGGEPLVPDPITGNNEAGKPQKQPDILKGWNEDYVKLDVDNNPAIQPITGESKERASYYMVTQNIPNENQWYNKFDIDNEPAKYKKYERVDFFNCFPCPVNPGEPADDNPDCPCGKPGGAITFTLDGEEAILALQDDRDNIFVTEKHIFHIRLEENTVITGVVSDSLVDTPDIDWITDEEGNRYIETNGMYTRIEENPV